MRKKNERRWRHQVPKPVEFERERRFDILFEEVYPALLTVEREREFSDQTEKLQTKRDISRLENRRNMLRPDPFPKIIIPTEDGESSTDSRNLRNIFRWQIKKNLKKNIPRKILDHETFFLRR
jgi:hypothetical protein